MNIHRITFVFTGLLFAYAAHAAPVSGIATSEEQARQWRERLTPVAEAVLSRQCGDGCPSVKLEPRFGRERQDNVDDIGFSKPAEPERAAELRSVAITVVHSRSLPETQLGSLKQILASTVSNEAGVPATVTFQAMPAASPLEARVQAAALETEKAQAIVLLRESLWPICAILLAGLALLGLLVHLRARRALAMDLFRAQAQAEGKPVAGEKPAEARPLTAAELREATLQLLDTRAPDLQWWIEDRASAADLATLKRWIPLFSPADLSTRLHLSSEALQALASMNAEEVPVTQKDLDGLRYTLDLSHWKRLAAEREPLSQVSSLSDLELSILAKRLPSAQERGLLLQSIPEGRWHAALSRLPSEQRVQLGFELAKGVSPKTNPKSETTRTLLDAARAVREADGTDVLNRFGLYLSEKEFQALRSQGAGAGQAHLSAEAIVASMEDAELIELCLRLELADLRVLVRSLPGNERQRIERLLPKSVQERLRVSQSQRGSAEGEQLRARAAFIGAYRKAFGTEMVQ